MMFYSRGKDGKINGAYACRQDFKTEELPDDHADVAAWRSAAAPKPRNILAELDEAQAAIRALVKKGVVAKEEIDSEKSR